MVAMHNYNRIFKKVKGQSRFQAKVKGQRAEVKSLAKILPLTAVAGGSMEVCEVTHPLFN